ncbi:MAG TPA: hypothetical protein VMV22_09180 [Acidimicrobiales bacterium]|nr:hypothetical protein [Acidimicrobiales bacterium]
MTDRTVVVLGGGTGGLVAARSLHRPGAIPGLERIGPVLENLGRACPRFAAFQVLVIDKAP